MGAVKSYIDDLTYAIIEDCGLEDDPEGHTHDAVFRWVMKKDFAHSSSDEIISLYEKENLL